MNRRWVFAASFVLVAVSVALTGCQGAGTTSTATPDSTAGASDGQTLLDANCTTCHTLDRVTLKRADGADKAAWEQTITRMQQKGATLTDAEKTTLIEYLTAQ